MLRAVNFVLAAIAVVTAWFLVSFKDKLTTRAISSPTSGYTIPYDTHGAVVYVSQGEHNIILYGWITTGVLIAFQLVLNYMKSKRK